MWAISCLWHFLVVDEMSPKSVTIIEHLYAIPQIIRGWITYLGNVKRGVKLNFEKRTEVKYSCGATLNGQHWIIGGFNKERQVSHLQKSHSTIKTVI